MVQILNLGPKTPGRGMWRLARRNWFTTNPAHGVSRPGWAKHHLLGWGVFFEKCVSHLQFDLQVDPDSGDQYKDGQPLTLLRSFRQHAKYYSDRMPSILSFFAVNVIFFWCDCKYSGHALHCVEWWVMHLSLGCTTVLPSLDLSHLAIRFLRWFLTRTLYLFVTTAKSPKSTVSVILFANIGFSLSIVLWSECI